MKMLTRVWVAERNRCDRLWFRAVNFGFARIHATSNDIEKKKLTLRCGKRNFHTEFDENEKNK